MDGAQVFTCGSNNTLMSRFSKNNNADRLFLQVENGGVSGRGYVCNEEGKNGYLDDFSFQMTEVKNVFIGEYMGMEALGFNARVSNLYGSKNVQIILPQLKSMNLVLSLINRLKSGAEIKSDESRIVQTKVEEAPKEEAAPTPVSVAAARVQAEEAHQAAQQPVAEPVPEVKPVAQTSVNAAAAEEARMSADEFQKRMDKLTVLKECGLLGEKEFNAKKIELVSEFCDLAEFNEKIQKLIVLKDCGLLSEKEFEANRNDIIKECCNVDTPDLEEYRKSVQKLIFLEMGGVISTEEYEHNKGVLLEDVELKLEDSKDVFVRKLRRLPILRECRLITEKEHRHAVDAMYEMIEVSSDDAVENLANKLNKWPILAQEGLINSADLKQKQKSLVAKYLNTDWSTPAELEVLIRKMMAMKEGDWLTEMDFFGRKEEITRKVEAISDYSTKIEMYMMFASTGFITDKDYEKQKQKCIDDIFKTSGSMDEFKIKVNNLLELQKVGMISEEEFTTLKTKLMSEL